MSVIKPFVWSNKVDIESKANQVLDGMQAHPKYSFKDRVDSGRVADFLNLDVCHDSIPEDGKGKIVARIFPMSRLIEINDDIPELRENSGFLAFTLAHEIGHWNLHINHDEVDGISEQQELNLEISTETQTFLCRSFDKGKPDNIEWQANYFAGCLLMPLFLLEKAAVGRNLQSWAHLRAMKEDLGVSIDALKVRLIQIGWINIPRNSQQIYLGPSNHNGQGNIV